MATTARTCVVRVNTMQHHGAACCSVPDDIISDLIPVTSLAGSVTLDLRVNATAVGPGRLNWFIAECSRSAGRAAHHTPAAAAAAAAAVTAAVRRSTDLLLHRRRSRRANRLARPNHYHASRTCRTPPLFSGLRRFVYLARRCAGRPGGASASNDGYHSL